MKVIVYKNNDDRLSVINPCYKDDMTNQEKDEYVKFIKNKDVPKQEDGSATASWLIDVNDLPDIRKLRNAWNINESGQIYFDRDKAIEIKKQQFRNLRKPLLEKLDVDFMKSLENGNTSLTDEIISKKQILRDITNIDMSQYNTPESLYNYIPDVLKQ